MGQVTLKPAWCGCVGGVTCNFSGGGEDAPLSCGVDGAPIVCSGSSFPW